MSRPLFCLLSHPEKLCSNNTDCELKHYYYAYCLPLSFSAFRIRRLVNRDVRNLGGHNHIYMWPYNHTSWTSRVPRKSPPALARKAYGEFPQSPAELPFLCRSTQWELVMLHPLNQLEVLLMRLQGVYLPLDAIAPGHDLIDRKWRWIALSDVFR